MSKSAKDEGWGIERWSGDRDTVQDLWPGDKVLEDEHQHIAPCGGYFNHSHTGGQVSHQHTHKQCKWCEPNGNKGNLREGMIGK
jgi:hypothetical protein